MRRRRPGSFYDRSVLESDPYKVVEGMIIGGYAIGANSDIFTAVRNIRLRLKDCRNTIKDCKEIRTARKEHSSQWILISN